MADQQLNSVERFRKQPGRLVLEEHGNCEVPAGCGGVVLRWRNPLATIPVLFTLYTPKESTITLDGAPLERGRVDLAPGRHVVALALQDVDLSAGLLLMVIRSEEVQGRKPASVREQPLKVVSAVDGTWKYTLDPPADEWTALDFANVGWGALVAVTTPQLERGSRGAWAVRRCSELGATCLGLPVPSEAAAPWWQRLLRRPAPPRQGEAPVGNIWIRKVFEVPLPQAAPAT